MLANKKGFTLLELLISISILAIIVSIVYSSYYASVSTLKSSKEMVEGYHNVRIVFKRISSDIAGAFVPLTARTNSLNLEENFNFIGRDQGNDEFPNDSIEFSAIISKFGFDPNKETELSRILYYLGKETNDDGTRILYRKEISPYNKETNESKGEELGDRILGLDFKFIDSSGAEVDSWNSIDLNTLLPIALKVTIFIKLSDDKLKPFTTRIFLATAG